MYYYFIISLMNILTEKREKKETVLQSYIAIINCDNLATGTPFSVCEVECCFN